MRDDDHFDVVTLKNDSFTPPPTVGQLIQDRTEVHRQELAREYRDALMFGPSREELSLRDQIHEKVVDHLGIRREVEALNALRRGRRDAVLKAIAAERFSPDPPPPLFDLLPPDIGLPMWWAQTSWYFSVHSSTVWMDDDGVHFAAKYESHDGDLHQYWPRIVATFVLDESVTPPTTGQLYSTTFSELLGTAYGFTNRWGIWDFGDLWSKCWLHTRQSILLHTPDTSLVNIEYTARDSRSLVSVDGDGLQKVPLPGLLALPPVRFAVPAAPEKITVIAELAWEFHVQVEGDEARLWLGHTTQAATCTLRHPQWHLRTTL